MTTYTGTLTGSGVFTGTGPLAGVTEDESQSDAVTANLTISGNSFSGTEDQDTNTTVTINFPGVPPSTTTTPFDSGAQSVSGSFPYTFTTTNSGNTITETWTLSSNQSTITVTGTDTYNASGISGSFNFGGTLTAPTSAPPPPQLPDLSVSAPSLSTTTIVAGASFTVTDTITNVGEGDAPGADVGVYISTSPNVTTSDTKIGSSATYELDPDEPETLSIPATIPDSFNDTNQNATYYVAVIANDNQAYQEVSFSNNTSSGVRVSVPVYPVAVPDSYIVAPGTTTQLNVLSNDTPAGVSGLGATIVGTTPEGFSGLGSFEPPYTGFDYTAPALNSPHTPETVPFEYTAQYTPSGTTNGLVSAPVQDTVTIENPLIELVNPTPTLAEPDPNSSGGTLTFNFAIKNLSNPAQHNPFTVNYYIDEIPNGAVIGADLLPLVTTSITVPNGQSTFQISVHVNGSAQPGDKSFYLVLEPDNNADLPSPGSAYTQEYLGTITGPPASTTPALPNVPSAQQPAQQIDSSIVQQQASQNLNYGAGASSVQTSLAADKNAASVSVEGNVNFTSLDSMSTQDLYEFLTSDLQQTAKLTNSQSLPAQSQDLTALSGDQEGMQAVVSDSGVQNPSQIINVLLDSGLPIEILDSTVASGGFLFQGSLEPELGLLGSFTSATFSPNASGSYLTSVLTDTLTPAVSEPNVNDTPLLTNANGGVSLNGAIPGSTAPTPFATINPTTGVITWKSTITPAITALLNFVASRIDIPVATESNFALTGNSVAGSSDTIVAGGGNDSLVAGPGSTTMIGGAGNDTMTPGSGTDNLYGGTGTTTAIYSGTRAQYTVNPISGNAVQIVDKRAGTPNGISNDSNVTLFQFADRTLNFAQVIDLTAPTLTHEKLLQVGIGHTAAITSSLLQFADTVSLDAQETYTITSAPAHGLMLKNGVAVSSFTQADIDDGLITYQENGSFAASDTFSFTVSDVSGNTTASQQFSIQVLPVAQMMLRNTPSGALELYDINNNQITAYSMGQIGLDWSVAGLGDFSSNPDEADMLMRNTNTGAFELYDISNNQYTGGGLSFGQVGTGWAVEGFGDFSSKPNETDMLMRNTSTGAFELYDISNNTYSGFFSLGQVGPEWSVVGFGDFSGNANETDMLMRNAAGLFEVYDIANNQIYHAQSMGQVGPEWSVVGFGDFSGKANETDMLMRNAAGAFELYDISNNQIYHAQSMGQVGPVWQVTGIGDFTGNVNESDMLMRNTSTGVFQLYDISQNAYTGFPTLGQVGLSWSVAGLSIDSPAGSLATTMAPLLVNDGTLPAGMGLNTVITKNLLQFTDNFSSDAQETYALTAAPAHGTLLRNGVAVMSFTQNDIDSGLISYLSAGSSFTSDSFSFTVTDAAANATPAESFQISLSDKSPPAATHNSAVNVGIGRVATITSSQLQFDDNVSAHAQETYTITTTPADGTVLKNGTAVTSFTQADIDNGLITYKENGTVAASDSFSFTVTDAAGNKTATQKLSITVTPPAELFMRDTITGDVELYGITNNQYTGFYSLGQVGTEWTIVGIGDFSGKAGESDMLMQNTSGAFQLFDISNYQYSGFPTLGQVGQPWQVAGFGDFSSRANETDMLMRNANTGAFQLYDIQNNQMAAPTTLGQVGPEWSVVGFGDFSGNANETDMLMRNAAGAFEVYDIAKGQLYNAHSMGQVGPEWSVVGFGDFSGNANETDMLMRNAAGAFELYDITGNQIYNAQSMGQVGPEWSTVGFGDFSGNANETDMLMRRTDGTFVVYDITNNQIYNSHNLGQVGTEWVVGGVAANMPNASGALTAQLAQALSSFAPAGSNSTSGNSQTTDQQNTQLSSMLITQPAAT